MASDEAVEAGRKAFREGGYGREIVEAAEPIIRSEEREALREKLLGEGASIRIQQAPADADAIYADGYRAALAEFRKNVEAALSDSEVVGGGERGDSQEQRRKAAIENATKQVRSGRCGFTSRQQPDSRGEGEARG